MIPIYNRYVGNSGKFTRVNDGPGDPGFYTSGNRAGQPYRDPSPQPPQGAWPQQGPQQGAPPGTPANTGPPQGSWPQQGPPQGSGPQAEPPPFQEPPKKKPPGKFLGGLGDMLGGVLPFGFEIGDLMLLLVLLFLYTESHDEEFLIILVVLGYTLYKSHGGKPLTKFF